MPDFDVRVPHYDLHVFGLNFGSSSEQARRTMYLSRREVHRLLRSVALTSPSMEVVVVRARNHVEAFVAAPAGANAIRSWVSLLRTHRPDLLQPDRRSLHYYLCGPAAETHLTRLATGAYAQSAASSTVTDGLKDSLSLAARCGSLGDALNRLFIEALAARAPGASLTSAARS